MCLSVYLGCRKPLEVEPARIGELALEIAAHSPACLKHFPFVYYLGRKGEGSELECSCILYEHVEWKEGGLEVFPDTLAEDDPKAPFDALRRICESALAADSWATLACDDSGGVEISATPDDYDDLYLDVSAIRAGVLLFSHPVASFPWRRFQLFNSST